MRLKDESDNLANMRLLACASTDHDFRDGTANSQFPAIVGELPMANRPVFHQSYREPMAN